jgi:imidazolonepropionase
MLIHSASQLLTLAGGPQRGVALGELGLIENGAVLVREGTITATGPSDELLAAYPDEPTLNAAGRVVMPGFVDPHTHLIWAGDRASEFELRLQGKSYQEIMASGGGIASTVRATRSASLEDLEEQTRGRMHAMFRHGTTTAEAKTGYALETNGELRLLEALLALDEEEPLELVPTFLGAHATPPEYQNDPQAYVSLVYEEMLPALHAWWQTHAELRPLPFVDVFCENGAFNLDQSRRILETALDMGFPLKIHTDEFANIGGAPLAVELGAASADHIVTLSPEDVTRLAASPTVAVSLPCTPFGLAEQHYTPARTILEAGGLLAIATDLNPGTAWCESMQFSIALACRYLHLTPAQAIAAATINAAAAIQRDDRIGSLEPGKQADLIVLTIPDYRQLGYRFGTNLVSTVMKMGRVYSVRQ